MEMKDNETIGLKSVIVGYLLHWRLFLAAFAVSLVLAVAYLLCYPRTYEVMARVQIQDEKELGGGSFGLGEAAGLMKSFGLGGISGGGINIADELQVLTSNRLLREMVLELGVNVDYMEPFSLGYRLYEDAPLRLTADSLTNATLDEVVEFAVEIKDTGIEVTAESDRMEKKSFRLTSLPATLELPGGTFTLDFAPRNETQASAPGNKTLSQGNEPLTPGNETLAPGNETLTRGNETLAPGNEALAPMRLYLDYRPAGWVAEELADELLIEESSKTSNVIELSCTDYKKLRGKDMLNTLIRLYNADADAYKKGEALKALDFLDRRIGQTVGDLAGVENRIEAYKSENKLMDIEHDVQFYVDQMKDLQTRLIELEAQSNVVGMMDAFVKDPANRYSLMPVLLSVQEGEQGSSLANYNKVLLERARVIQNSSIHNPLAKALTEQADKLRVSVERTIGNARDGYQSSIADVRAKERQIYGKMNVYPSAERHYVDLKRQQEISQGVYLILLQKREETALILGQAREKARVVDAAFVKSKPVAPRKLYAAIGMLIFTLLVPVGWLCARKAYTSLRDACEEELKDKR